MTLCHPLDLSDDPAHVVTMIVMILHFVISKANLLTAWRPELRALNFINLFMYFCLINSVIFGS